MRKESKLPKEELKFCWIKLLERARGKFDMKRAGTEMTNGNGINMLENYSVVTDGLMKVFPEGTEIYEWLSEKTPRWQRLGEALLAVHLFLKGQGKKDDLECDILLYDLWVAWKDAYPDVDFNKFHGLFCATRNFNHKYGMAGRVSEESLESFNAVLAEVKSVLRGLPTTTGRMKKINERMQGNLKEEVSKDRMMIEEKYTGAKRGKYKERKRYDDRTKVVSSVQGTAVYKGERFFVLTDGSWLREEWKDIYDWFAGRLAPKTWRESLARSAPDNMSAVKTAKEDFSPW